MARETIETARLIRDGPPLVLLVNINKYTCKHDGYYKFRNDVWDIIIAKLSVSNLQIIYRHKSQNSKEKRKRKGEEQQK